MGRVDPIRRRAELLMAQLEAAVADLGAGSGRRLEARILITKLWRVAISVADTKSMRAAVLVQALDAARDVPQPEAPPAPRAVVRARAASYLAFRARVARSVLLLTYPEAKPSIEDETVARAVAHWRTADHSQWPATIALARELGMKGKPVAIRAAIKRAMQRARAESTN